MVQKNFDFLLIGLKDAVRCADNENMHENMPTVGIPIVYCIDVTIDVVLSSVTLDVKTLSLSDSIVCSPICD